MILCSRLNRSVKYHLERDLKEKFEAQNIDSSCAMTVHSDLTQEMAKYNRTELPRSTITIMSSSTHINNCFYIDLSSLYLVLFSICFYVCLRVRSSVCQLKNSLTIGQILIKLSETNHCTYCTSKADYLFKSTAAKQLYQTHKKWLLQILS